MKNKIISLIGLVLVLVGMGIYLMTRNSGSVIEKVSRLMEIPDEPPTIATVVDVTKLVGQKFFEKAQNGDQVLIFSQAQQAILYRESTNKIVVVGHIDETRQPERIVTPTGVTQPLTVALYNGTTKAGLTTRYEKIIKDNFPQVIIQSKDKAVRDDFVETVVVDVGQQDRATVELVARLLGATISEMPVDEVKPEVDVIIIFGKNSL